MTDEPPVNMGRKRQRTRTPTTHRLYTTTTTTTTTMNEQKTSVFNYTFNDEKHDLGIYQSRIYTSQTLGQLK